MPVFSPAYNTGLVAGIALGAAISVWWYSRPSIYERVKSEVQKPPANTKARGLQTGAKSKTAALTSFEARLYKACQCIPRGKVATYGMLASLLSSCARAVGQGMRRNKFAPVVPCHRVVAADLGLGGFHGSWGAETNDVKRKRQMLLDEGVRLEGCQISQKSLISTEELKQLYDTAGDFDARRAAAELAA